MHLSSSDPDGCRHLSCSILNARLKVFSFALVALSSHKLALGAFGAAGPELLPALAPPAANIPGGLLGAFGFAGPILLLAETIGKTKAEEDHS